MATHSSILAWKIPWVEKRGRLQAIGPKESDPTEHTPAQITNLAIVSFPIIYIFLLIPQTHKILEQCYLLHEISIKTSCSAQLGKFLSIYCTAVVLGPPFIILGISVTSFSVQKPSFMDHTQLTWSTCFCFSGMLHGTWDLSQFPTKVGTMPLQQKGRVLTIGLREVLSLSVLMNHIFQGFLRRKRKEKKQQQLEVNFLKA